MKMNYIKKTSGRLPAIRGLDYINEDFDGVTQRAIDWWKQGGIVSICWHWGTPPDGVGCFKTITAPKSFATTYSIAQSLHKKGQ